MRAYVARRLLVSILVIAGLSLLSFSMIHLVPGDPVRLIYGRHMVSQEILDNVRHQLGLDAPLPVQYFRFVTGALKGDLGRSLRSQRPVTEELWIQGKSTFQLTAAALVISILIGAPIGLFAALRRGSIFDKATMVGAMLGISVPSFLLGLLFIYAFAVRLDWLPVIGQGGGKGLVLPALTLGLAEAALVARLLRSSLLEVLGEDYMVTARAKGLHERQVILRHALRNALIPVITLIGLEAGYLLAGSVIVEVVFARPGLGNLAVEGILNRDFPVVQGVVLFTSVVFVVVNTVVDLLYAAADPRIKYR